MKRFISLCLCGLLCCCALSGCAASDGGSGDLMRDIEPQLLNGEAVAIGGDNAAASADFAVRLFQASLRDGQNTLLSPVSVLCALSMTATGLGGIPWLRWTPCSV